jgi:hypothetical protein
MIRFFVGIDNGTSGSVGIVPTEGKAVWFKIPVRNELSYTKTKKFINRVDLPRLAEFFNAAVPLDADIVCKIERPMVNPMRFNATLSAIRALEALQIFFEGRKVPYGFIDSREWQKKMLPAGLEGSEQLKLAADTVCRRLFPGVSIAKGGGDSLLIAKYLHG